MPHYDKNQVAVDLRVGIVTLSAIIILIFGIAFAGGDKGLLFRKVSKIKAQMTDVGGLKKGGSVTMGGMTIGKVTEITFVDANSEMPNDNRIEVAMEIRSDRKSRIKKDAVPAVRTQGM